MGMGAMGGAGGGGMMSKMGGGMMGGGGGGGGGGNMIFGGGKNSSMPTQNFIGMDMPDFAAIQYANAQTTGQNPTKGISTSPSPLPNTQTGDSSFANNMQRALYNNSAANNPYGLSLFDKPQSSFGTLQSDAQRDNPYGLSLFGQANAYGSPLAGKKNLNLGIGSNPLGM